MGSTTPAVDGPDPPTSFSASAIGSKDGPRDRQLARQARQTCTRATTAQQNRRPVRFALLPFGCLDGDCPRPVVRLPQRSRTTARKRRLAPDERCSATVSTVRLHANPAAERPFALLPRIRAEQPIGAAHLYGAARPAVLQDLDGLQIPEGGQKHLQFVRAGQFSDRVIDSWLVAGKPDVRRWLQVGSPERQPEKQRAPSDFATASQPVDVVVLQIFPRPGDVARDLDIQERIHDAGERFLCPVLVDGVDNEGVAQMEHSLLAESEPADGSAIGSLNAVAEREDALPVPGTELAVVHDEQSRALQEGIARIPPARQRIQAESACPCVVRVLQELLQDWVAGSVAILKVPFDQVDDRERVRDVAGHVTCPLCTEISWDGAGNLPMID